MLQESVDSACADRSYFANLEAKSKIAPSVRYNLQATQSTRA